MDNQIRVKRFTGTEEECNQQFSAFLDDLKNENKGKAFGIIDVAQGMDFEGKGWISLLYHLVQESKLMQGMMLPNRSGIKS